MDQWDNYFPPLNLWNYSLSWQWNDSKNLSDGGVLSIRQLEIVETATRDRDSLKVNNQNNRS